MTRLSQIHKRFQESYRERFRDVIFWQKPAQSPRTRHTHGSDLLANTARTVPLSPEVSL